MRIQRELVLVGCVRYDSSSPPTGQLRYYYLQGSLGPVREHGTSIPSHHSYYYSTLGRILDYLGSFRGATIVLHKQVDRSILFAFE